MQWIHVVKSIPGTLNNNDIHGRVGSTDKYTNCKHCYNNVSPLSYLLLL